MMDSFDAKRGMVKQLLDMLKSHASNEVSTGLQKPEGEDDMHGVQIEKVEVLPEHKMDEATPEHAVKPEGPDENPLTEMNTGGMVPDSPEGQPEKEGAAHEEATESEAERESEGDVEPMFTSLFGRKKKK